MLESVTMNANPRSNDFLFGQPNRYGDETSDQQMDQVRELLFGAFRREFDARLSVIETRMGALEARVDALSGQIDADRRNTFDVLAKGVGELGDQFRRLSRP